MRKIIPPVELDSIDRRILTELQANGRLTNAEMAERVGLSPSPCWRRIRRLEEAGIVKGHVTLLDADRIGLGVSVFVRVILEKHTTTLRDDFEATIMRQPEVMECYAMTGTHDYQLRIVVPDVAAYEEFLNRTLMPIAGIASVNSNFALKQVKYSTALPV